MSTQDWEDYRWAVQTGDLNNTKKFATKLGVKVVDAGVNARTPLHWAADYGQLEILEFLVAQGADLEAKDRFGITPLLAAVHEGHAEAVKFLLSKGANRNVKGPDGLSAADAGNDAIKKLFA